MNLRHSTEIVRPSARQGLSLLEVVMAVTLLTGALFTLGVLIPRSVMHLRNKSFETVATQLAEKILDESRGLDSADVPSGRWDTRRTGGRTPDTPAHVNRPRRRFPPSPYPLPDTSGNIAPLKVTVQQNGQAVQVEYHFLVEVAAPSPGLPRTITVSVFWQEPRGGDMVDRTWKITSEIGQ